MKKIILSMGLLIFSFSAQAMEATVILVKGTVKTASGKVLVLKDKIPAGETVSTEPRSFVKLLFKDNSQLNVGPESSVKIEPTQEGEPGLVNLVSGQIRSKVTKDPLKSDQAYDRFRVKTKTAAMGVRGTDFQVIYNGENENTSVITYEGTVAVASPDGRDPVFVQPGQFSGISPEVTRPSVPVKVSPAQLESLKGNETMQALDPNTAQKSEGKSSPIPPGVDPRAFASGGDRSAAEQLGLTAAPVEAPSANAPPPEGFFDAKTGEYAPRAGGLIDIKTGIYVPPPPGSAFDPNTGVYMPPAAMGKFDPATGSYVPPKGVELDAKKGFVPEGTKANSANQGASTNKPGTPGAGTQGAGKAPSTQVQAMLQFMNGAMDPAKAGTQASFEAAPMPGGMAPPPPPPPPGGIGMAEPIGDPTCPTCKESFTFIPPPPPPSATTVNFNIVVQ